MSHVHASIWTSSVLVVLVNRPANSTGFSAQVSNIASISISCNTACTLLSIRRKL